MREVAPSVAVSGIVLPNGCPLSLRNVRTPLLPVLLPFTIFLQSLLLFTEVFVVVYNDHGGRKAGSREDMNERSKERK